MVGHWTHKLLLSYGGVDTQGESRTSGANSDQQSVVYWHTDVNLKLQPITYFLGKACFYKCFHVFGHQNRSAESGTKVVRFATGSLLGKLKQSLLFTAVIRTELCDHATKRHPRKKEPRKKAPRKKSPRKKLPYNGKSTLPKIIFLGKYR